jgi:hypothetical protein
MRAPRLSTAQFAVAVFVIASLSANCRRQTAGEEIISRIKPTPPPSSSGDCHFDLSGLNEVTVFRTLGMLEEYLGRDIAEDSDMVEKFSGAERQPAEAFRRVTTQLAREQGMQPPLVEDTADHTYFRSRPLAERVNSCYAYTMTNGSLYEGPNRVMLRSTTGTLPRTLFKRSGEVRMDPAGGISDNVLYRRRALAYVSGAWRRNQRGADLVFANSQKKAALVGELLNDLGARHVTVESTVGFIPQANMVHFTPSPLIAEWLGQTW